MKFALLFFIKLYWLLIPENKRKCCLFHESCSKFVYRTTIEKGFLRGLNALFFRFKFCRPGNQIIEIKGEKFLVTKGYDLLKFAD